MFNLKRWLWAMCFTLITLLYATDSFATWLIYQTSTKKYLGNTGTQDLNGKPWVPPKAQVLKTASEQYGISLADLDVYFVSDTNTDIIKQMFDNEKIPQLKFDTSGNPIGVVFKDDIQAKREKRILQIKMLGEEIKNLESLETKYELNLTPEKTEKEKEIKRLKQELETLGNEQAKSKP